MTSGPAADAPVVVRAAPAKLNLYLRVVGRRPDGYHELDSLVAFAEIGDTVRATPAPHDSLTLALDGPFAGALTEAGPPDRNLVLRAARALAELAAAPHGARLTLTKHLPVASGIGGGSADAAATLQALCALWQVASEPAALRACALALGADVPVCLDGRPCRMQGIGETLAPLAALPATPLVLVNPGMPLDTGAVFRARAGAFSPPLEHVPGQIDAPADLAALVRAGGNDLAAPARQLLPVIGDVLAALGTRPGCLAAAMSGSGATCFGLFTSAATAALAAGDLRAAQPGWWVTATRLRALASPAPV